MKKLTAMFLILGALATTAFAHHLSPSDEAGGEMNDNSGHLLLDLSR